MTIMNMVGGGDGGIDPDQFGYGLYGDNTNKSYNGVYDGIVGFSKYTPGVSDNTKYVSRTNVHIYGFGIIRGGSSTVSGVPNANYAKYVSNISKDALYLMNPHEYVVGNTNVYTAGTYDISNLNGTYTTKAGLSLQDDANSLCFLENGTYMAEGRPCLAGNYGVVTAPCFTEGDPGNTLINFIITKTNNNIEVSGIPSINTTPYAATGPNFYAIGMTLKSAVKI